MAVFCTQCHTMGLGLRKMEKKGEKNVKVWNFYEQKWEKVTKVIYKCSNGHTISWTY